MEIIESCLSTILSIIADNFWQLLIIIALLKNNRCHLCAILLLFSHLMFGYQWYVYLIIFIITSLFTMVTNSTNDINNREKEAYETRIKEIEDKLKEYNIKIEYLNNKIE